MAHLPGQIVKQWRGFFPSFCLCVLLLLPALTSAQEGGLPSLINAAVTEDGKVVIFYPDGWLVSSGDALQLTQLDDTPIKITARIMAIDQAEAEALPEWIIHQFFISPSIPISPVNYGGVDGWIAQGAFLFEPGIHSALVVLPIASGQAAVIRIDSPTLEIGDNAPLITAMLERLIILPQEASGANLPMTLNLPQEWQAVEAVDSLQIASNSALSSSEIITGEDFTAQIFVNDAAILSAEPPAQQQVRDFLVNDQPARMQLTADRATGAGILTFTREGEGGQILVMRVMGATPQALVDQLPMLQALFASIAFEN